MCVHIAIPEPTSSDAAFNQRSLSAYLFALRSSGATPILIPLHERQDRVARLLAGVQGILLPGSRFDVDPQRYGEQRQLACGEADPLRTAVDELLLQDAFSLHKPVLGICHGLQSMNVWCNGTLVQHLESAALHQGTPEAAEVHAVRVAPGSRLARMVPRTLTVDPKVNSSHHQAVHQPGDNLLVSAVSTTDGVVEAIELDSAAHFVLGVQWHPERTYAESAFSRAIFAGFVQAAMLWQPRVVEESVVQA
jgi:putative glutamine amidotransferase